MKQYQSIVLASASPSRRRILENAGLAVQVIPANVDEASLKAAFEGEQAISSELALRLAEAKAAEVSARSPQHPVIGADQILICGGKRFDKANNRSQAIEHLSALQGQGHDLISAIVLRQGDHTLWSYAETARLTMRPLSRSDIETYLDRAGDAVLGSVGCYFLEGRGAWLFESVDGDFFSVLGLPLLPLLESLRRLGIVA